MVRAEVGRDMEPPFLTTLPKPGKCFVIASVRILKQAHAAFTCTTGNGKRSRNSSSK